MTRVVSAIALSAFVLSGLAACKQEPKVDPKAEAAQIDAVEDAMRAAYKAKDAGKLVATYANDATLYTPGERPRVGAGALMDGARRDLADPAFSITFTTVKTQVSQAGDLGYTQGSFSYSFTDPKTKMPVTQQGYYLTVFRKQADGSWKAVEDMGLPMS